MVKRIIAVSLLAATLGAVAVGGAAPAAAKASKPPKLFPVAVKASNGTITIRKRPVRIVSLSPTATESLYAVGAGRQVVAVDDQSNYPQRAPRTTLSGFKPNAEAVARYRPDLVIVAYDPGIVAELRKLGIAVLHLEASKNLAESYGQIVQIGRATGHPRRAASLVKHMRARIGAAVRSVQRRTRALSVYHELSPDYYSATSKTFIGQVYGLFGLRNIADAAAGASDYPKLSGEYIIAANPDVIVLADSKCCGQRHSTVAARPGWSTISAVQNRRVIAVDDDIASRWGPRIVRFVQIVAARVRSGQG